MAYFLQSYGLNNVQNHRLSNMPSLVIVELTRILFLAWKKYADPFEIIYANCGIAPCLSVFFALTRHGNTFLKTCMAAMLKTAKPLQSYYALL